MGKNATRAFSSHTPFTPQIYTYWTDCTDFLWKVWSNSHKTIRTLTQLTGRIRLKLHQILSASLVSLQWQQTSHRLSRFNEHNCINVQHVSSYHMLCWYQVHHICVSSLIWPTHFSDTISPIRYVTLRYQTCSLRCLKMSHSCYC